MSTNVETTLGIGIIGCGYWGKNYVRVFNELPDSHVVGVCDVKPERLAALEERFAGTYTTTCMDELLERDDVDALVICTQAANHYPTALRALEAGKSVLVEKPLTTDLAEAQELAHAAESLGLVLMVGHTFIYHSALRKVKEFVDESRDSIYYIHARRTNMGPIRRDVNAVWDLATHDVSIQNFLLNSQPEWVSAVGAKLLHNCREDVGFIVLGYPGNILGHIHVSWTDPAKVRELVVVCGDRRIVFNDLNGLEQVRIFEKGIHAVPAEPDGFGEYQLEIRDGDILSPKIEATEPLRNECRHFLDCVQLGLRPLTGAREGMDVLRVLDAIDRSIALGGAKVEVTKDEQYATSAVAGAFH